jgi:hypothetical protein
MVAQLYPQALGSVFVASYDSQIYEPAFTAKMNRLTDQLKNVVVILASEEHTFPACLGKNSIVIMSSPKKDGR